ncbi:MAG: hypothetical protein MJ238_06495, partial [Bacilli bacterium]|nr:hypothetical protein [Bacilli bacterium]
QITTQSIRQIFCKENKIKTAEGMFDMSFNSSSYKLFALEDTSDTIYYMPENETVERMFYKSSLTGFNYIFKAPKLMNLKEMFRSSEVHSVVLKFADWGLPKGYDCSYILADLQHIAQTEFGTEGKTYPGNVEGMFKLSTITGKPYIDLSTFDFSMCNNFKGMFEGVSGYVQQITFLNETAMLPDGTSFDSMFCNFRAGLKDFSFLRWLRVERPDMRLMFLYVRDIDRIDIRGFNLANATNLNGLIDCSLNPNCTIYVGTEADAIALRNSSSTPELLKIIVVGR